MRRRSRKAEGRILSLSIHAPVQDSVGKGGEVPLS